MHVRSADPGDANRHAGCVPGRVQLDYRFATGAASSDIARSGGKWPTPDRDFKSPPRRMAQANARPCPSNGAAPNPMRADLKLASAPRNISAHRARHPSARSSRSPARAAGVPRPRRRRADPTRRLPQAAEARQEGCASAPSGRARRPTKHVPQPVEPRSPTLPARPPSKAMERSPRLLRYYNHLARHGTRHHLASRNPPKFLTRLYETARPARPESFSSPVPLAENQAPKSA